MEPTGRDTSGQERVIDAVVTAARAWRDPEYGPREEAVERTLGAPNRFTEEALAFAINQQMEELSEEKLRAWLGGRRAQERVTVGVHCSGDVPLEGLRDCLAVLLAGHTLLVRDSATSPHLLPAFLEEIARYVQLEVRRTEMDELLRVSSAVIAMEASNTSPTMPERCDEHGIPSARRLLRKRRFSVGILDGHESEDEREGLAEDMLLHEGMGSRNVVLLWAPEDVAPDPYLHAMAAFRAVFPAHADTPGSLSMQQAMLEAVNHPHAYGEGLEFLISRGEPEPQGSGHIRWVPYESLHDATDWIEKERDTLHLVVARERLHETLPGGLEVRTPGEAHRPSLGRSPEETDTIAFLVSL